MNSIFLATVIGWYMVIFGILMLVRHKQMRSVMADLMAQRGLFFILALMTFILGLLLVMSHNVWVTGWPVSITIFSWFVLVGGLIRLFFLDEALKIGRSFLSEPIIMNIMAILFLIFGVYLLFHVYY